jgi:uncharacterized membrane protein
MKPTPQTMWCLRRRPSICEDSKDGQSRQTVPVATPYNRFSGQSLERIQALSDGVFAVALTLLVLDLRVPVGAADTDGGLWEALSTLGPSFVAYLLSFTMLGTFWLAQHTFLGLCTRADRALTWTQLGFLIVVTLLPFSASLLAEYVTVRLAVGVYWLNLVLLGVGLAVGGRHAAGTGLVDPPQLRSLQIFRRRIWFAQSCYAVAALLCLLSTYVSVGALALVQLYFIVSPRVRLLDGILLQRADQD